MSTFSAKKQSNKRSWQSIAWEYLQAILIALVLALFIRTFVVQAFKIPSGSMKNTLLIGDHILVNKFIYGVRNPFTRELWIPVKKPERGDVAVFIYPMDRKKDFIKRMVELSDWTERSRPQIKKLATGALPAEP